VGSPAPFVDEGRATAPKGDTVDFRNTVLIATSNVGAQEAAKSLGFGVASQDDRQARNADRIRTALEAVFRPEFLNRFQHIVVFHPLSVEQLRTVARQEIARVLGREGIAGQNLVVDVDDSALDVVIANGADARYSARALKREVQRTVVLPLAMVLTEQAVLHGSTLRVSAKDGAVRIRVVETEASRAQRAEQKPARDADGRALTLADLSEEVARALGRIDALARELDLPRLSSEQARLLEERNAPEFWKGGARAERLHRELRAIEASIARVARLEERGKEVRAAIGQASGRDAIEKVAIRIRSLDAAIDDARRELVLLGWEGSADALIEIRPVGGTGRGARISSSSCTSVGRVPRDAGGLAPRAAGGR
jgi:AAA domain (Cdc48 subfamily)/C-terminal, D2-small domain, of ClpB protein